MRLIKNAGGDRVIDELCQSLASPTSLDLASSSFSLFAFAKLRDLLERLEACRLVMPAIDGHDVGLTGSASDRAFRNRLQLRWLARQCAAWVGQKVQVRGAPAQLPQSILIAGRPESEHHHRQLLFHHGNHPRQPVQSHPVFRETRAISHVGLNLEIKRLESEIASISRSLRGAT